MDESSMPKMDKGSHKMVWLQKDGNLTPRPVKTGMSDVAYIIIEEGLQAGDSVVLSAQYVAKEKEKKTGENPFMPGPPGKNKNSNKSGGNPPAGPR